MYGQGSDPRDRSGLVFSPPVGHACGMDSPPAEERRPLAVLAKAMSALEQLAARGEATPAELAVALGEPRSSVYRLLGTLRELDYVESGGRRGTYRLSLRLFSLGSAALDRYDVREAARPGLEHLHETTGETVFLCVRRGLDAVCIDRIAGSRVELLELRLGGTMPLHVGAAPRALLGFESESAWREYLERASLALGTGAPHDPDALIAELRRTRARGYAVSDEDVTPGIASIGAPIFGRDGEVRASLSIGGVRQLVLDPDGESLRQVIAAADAASAALGFRAENSARERSAS